MLDFCEVSTQIPCNDIVKERHSRVNTCQMSNPYRQRCFQSSLLPVEWNCSENDWFISIKTPWNEPVVLIDRVGTIVLQCFSRWSLVLFHTSLWKRFHRIPLSHTKPIAPVEEERWRDNNKVISHSLQQAQMELQRTEQMLQQIRNSEDE